MINKTWHLKNKMPKNPSAKEKLEWNLKHAKNCVCRPLTKEYLAKLKSQIKKEG
jgi:hypothetical protein